MLSQEGTQGFDTVSCLRACPDHRIAQSAIEVCRFLDTLIVRQVNLIEADDRANVRRLADCQVAVKHTKMWFRLCRGEDDQYLVEISEHRLRSGSLSIHVGTFAQQRALTR